MWQIEWSSKGVHILIYGTCDDLTLHDKSEKNSEVGIGSIRLYLSNIS